MSKVTQLMMAGFGLLMTYAQLEATTIIPFKNLGDLAIHSDAVVRARALRTNEHHIGATTHFRTRLIVLDQLKGDLLPGDDFEVQKWERVIDDKWMTMWGDIDLYDGSTYLLFLEKRESGLYHPLCFSYYSFEEITMEGEAYFVPSEHSREFELVEIEGVEPLSVYHKDGLMTELSSVVSHQKTWSSKSFATELHHQDFFGHQHKQRSEPNHCNYLTSNNKYFRWPDFSSSTVAIHYHQDGQSGCSSANAFAQQCVNDLNAAYPSINLVDGGTVNYAPTCQFGSAIGSSYRNWIGANLGGQRHVMIQYDDPCNEIADLSGCSGTLAIGGLYGIGSHTYNGESWYTGGYGYVIVNNGVGGCKCSQMDEILTHEVTHALGLGHILSSNGDANMNPSCCEAISALDEACIAYSYDEIGGAFPLELIGFNGEANHFVNEIQWETAWEANVDRFILQRAHELDQQFVDLAIIESKGDTEFGHGYHFTDVDPHDEAYYRLMSIDHDGSTDYSDIIVISRDKLLAPQVYPTQTNDFLHVRMPEGMSSAIEIISPSGMVRKEGMISSRHAQLEVSSLPQGWYYLSVASDQFSETFKFFKTD